MYKIKTFLIVILLGFLACTQNAVAQDENAIARPHTSGVSSVDDYMTKVFDIYNASQELLYDIDFIRVDIKTIPATKDGATTEMKINNGSSGDPMGKGIALEQFNQLLARAMNLKKQAGPLPDMKKQAALDAEAASILKRSRATKELNTTNDAHTYLITEIKRQVDLLNKYIATIKGAKTRVN